MNPHFGKIDDFGLFVINIIGIVCLIFIIAYLVKRVIDFVKRKRRKVE